MGTCELRCPGCLLGYKEFREAGSACSIEPQVLGTVGGGTASFCSHGPEVHSVDKSPATRVHSCHAVSTGSRVRQVPSGHVSSKSLSK